MVNALVKLTTQSADGSFAAGVGCAQSAGGETAKVFARLDQDCRLAHLRRLNRRDDTGTGAAVDDDIGLVDVRIGVGRLSRAREPRSGEQGNEMAEFHPPRLGIRARKPIRDCGCGRPEQNRPELLVAVAEVSFEDQSSGRSRRSLRVASEALALQ